MTCEHIEGAKEKINNLIKKAGNVDSHLYRKQGPYVELEEVKKYLRQFSSSESIHVDRLALSLSFSIDKFHVININCDVFYDDLSNIFNELKDCDCRGKAYRDGVDKVGEELINSEKEYNEERKKEVEKYNELLLASKEIVKEKEYLEKENDRLEREFRDLNNEKKEKEDKIEELKGKQEEEKLEWTRTEGQKNAEIAEKEGEVKNLKAELEKEKNRGVKLEDKLDERNREIRELNNQLERLKINNENLQERTDLSQEELMKAERDRLELFAVELKIDLEQVHNLRRYHERLLQARKSNNQINITTHEDNIEKTKHELLEKKVNIIIIQEICRKCERIAEFYFGLEQSKKKQNLLNYININDWKNVNSNFTPELIQEWIRHGFTVEQCRDWINISPSSQQNLAVKESAYYAWLRDIKKVNAEWVLNNGNEQELGQEFFKWYQEQQQVQAQIEQPVK